MTITAGGTPGGGGDLWSIAEALRPLANIPQAMSAQTDELRAIKALLGGDTGVQDPNMRAAALGQAGGVPNPLAGVTRASNMPAGGGRIPASARGGTVVNPQGSPAAGGTSSVPGGGTQVTPSAQPGGGGPAGPGIGGGGGSRGGGGMGSGGGGGQQPSGPSGPLGYANSALAGMTQGSGDGLVNRAYGFATSKMPFLSIPNSIRNEYQSQINKNNYYVGMAGGDQGDAFGYRFREEKARLDYGAGFNEQEARTAFKGTVAQGYNTGGDSRQGRSSQKEVMDAIYAGKMKAGVTPEEMLNYTGTAARSATQDMQSLVQTLDDLGEAVGRAGGNAQQARAQFNQAWNQGISGGMTGAAAQQMASASSMANAQLGPMFANSNPMARLSGDAQYQYLVGAQMGLTSGQFTSAMSNDPMGVANAQSQTFVQYMGSYISSSNPDGWAWLQQEVSSGARSPEIIAEDFVSNHFGNMDRNAYVGMAQTFGIETSENLSDPMSVTRYLVKEMSGQSTGAMLAGQQAGVGTMTMSGKSTATGLTGSKKSIDEVIGKSSPGGASKVIGGLSKAITGSAYGIGKSGVSESGKAYEGLTDKTDKRYGGIEQVLSKLDNGKEDDQMVEVEGPDGKRVVTLAQAIKYYPNQLQSGIARFVGGKYGGKNIAAIAGGVDDSARQAGLGESSQVHNTKSHGYVGRTDDDYYKDHPDAKAKSGWKGPKAIIDLSPRAAKFFEITGYEDADASGEPRDNDNGMGSRLRGAASATANSVPGVSGVRAVLGWMS